jgi:hypothetical protein
MADGKHYVYAILVDGIVRYIGKGMHNRASFHRWFAVKLNERRARGEKVKTTKFHNRLAKALKNGAIVTYEKLRWFKTGEEAFAEEIRQIASREGLWNTLEGGNGLTSEESRALQSRLFADPEYARQRSEAGRQLGSDPKIKAKARAGRETPESKQKFKDSMRSFWDGDRIREIARANGIGVSTPESRKAASKRMRETMAKPENKAAVVAGNRKRMADPVQAKKTIANLAAARDRNNANQIFKEKQRAGVQAYWAKKRGEIQ